MGIVRCVMATQQRHARNATARALELGQRPIVRQNPSREVPLAGRGITAAGILVLLCCSVAAGQTFTSVTSDPDVGRFDHIVATADLDGDGRDDLIVGHLFLRNSRRMFL